MNYICESGEDKFLNENFFKNKKNGFFIDIGAHSGIWESKSLFFERDLEWDGVCVEPSPVNFSKLVENRKCKCLNIALSDKEEIVDFCVYDYINNGNVLTGDVVDGVIDGILKNYSDSSRKEALQFSRIPQKAMLANGVYKNRNVNIIKIKTYTFNNVFNYLQNQHIDFINIDTEGSELPILKGINFELFKIGFILFEKHCNNMDIELFLNQHGFTQIFCHFNNYIFQNKDQRKS